MVCRDSNAADDPPHEEPEDPDWAGCDFGKLFLGSDLRHLCGLALAVWSLVVKIELHWRLVNREAVSYLRDVAKGAHRCCLPWQTALNAD
jgi:hypothetical protein